MRFIWLAGLLLVVSLAFAQAPGVVVLGDFEAAVWKGLGQSDERVKGGRFSGEWADLKHQSSLAVPDIPRDWSVFDRLVFWLYSERPNGQRLTLTATSEDETKAGWDYFFYHLSVDWQGWKRCNLTLAGDFRPARHPLGWNQIASFGINSGGWGHYPLADTVLYLDDVKLIRDPVRLQIDDKKIQRHQDGSIAITYSVAVANLSQQPRQYKLEAHRLPGEEQDGGIYELAELPAGTPLIAPGERVPLPVNLRATAEKLAQAEPLTREEFVVQVKLASPDVPDPEITIAAAVPLPQRRHPFLFGDAEVFEQAKARAEEYSWAKDRLDGIINDAEAGLKAAIEIPDEPGQWSHHYVCKKCGAGLKYQHGKHVCRKCGAEYTGWPYDQVIAARAHHRQWRNICNLGLGYAFTGKEAYAEQAREILLAYADKYLSYPYHDVRGNESASAARVFAQTLDEAVAIIRVAWGYDLIYNSPCLSDDDRTAIETKFLREVVATIRRHDAGISNWQSWHNAGIAAVGFCLQDEDIASLAINGRSGLRFQLANSILSDGFWYEGTAAYHYYALDALRWTTEAAYFAGINFYDNQPYKSLYDAPLLYVFPDLTFPAVNDSEVFSITGRHRLYDLAYARFGDPKFLTVARHGGRKSLETFLWGVDKLPEAPQVAFESKDFSGIGAVVLRQGSGQDQLYLHLDYGPHGGGHGHPDKLTIILFALGQQLAPDPARLAYGAPLQGSWYKQTFAHNTVCVDHKSQAATQGKLTRFHSEPGFSIAQAECDAAYDGVMMRRTTALTEDYVIDIFSVSSADEHTYDWLYHNFGELEPQLPREPRSEPLGDGHGYQHIKDISEAETAETWSADFKLDNANVRLTVLGTPATQLYFGMGMANNPPQDCPMVVVRRKGTNTSFISILEPYRDTPAVSSVKQIAVGGGEGAVALEIARGQQRDLFMLAPDGGIEREFAGIKTSAWASWVRNLGQDTAQVVNLE